MTLAESLFSILLALPISPRDQFTESFDEHMARLRTVAEAIAAVADRAACHEQPAPCRRIISDRFIAAGVLTSQAKHESAFRADVQSGCCRPLECDRGRAMGLWQLHRAPTETEEQWRGYAGLTRQSLESGAWRAIRLFADGSSRGGLQCGFSRLATGALVCWPGYGKDREREALRVAGILRSEVTE